MLQFSEPVSVSDSYRQELLDFATEVVALAGARSLPFFRADVSVENKLDDGQFDPVTEADRAVEAVLREEIARRYPEHGICGEEFGTESGNGLTWVIDPIDGTRAFMSGMVHWGVLLALFDGERPVVGAMYQPFTEELWFGDGRHAEFRRGGGSRRLQVRQCDALSDAVLATTAPKYFPGENLARLEAAVKMTRYGGDCYLWAMLAMGYLDLATDAQLNPYDIQALIPIIEGAGGYVATYEGGNPSLGGDVLAAPSRALHEAAVAAYTG
jgi:myo-inositol-1(or 4)-monophosphatase